MLKQVIELWLSGLEEAHISSEHIIRPIIIQISPKILITVDPWKEFGISFISPIPALNNRPLPLLNSEIQEMSNELSSHLLPTDQLNNMPK